MSKQEAEQQPPTVHEKVASVKRPSLSLGTASSDSMTAIQYEPYVWHVIQGVIRDLQFLCNQNYLARTVLEEIVEKLPRPASTVISPRSSTGISITTQALNATDASQSPLTDSPIQTDSSRKPPETESPQTAKRGSQIHTTEEESSPSSPKNTKSLQPEDSDNKETSEQPASPSKEHSRPSSQYPVQPLQYLTDDDSTPPMPERKSSEIIYIANASPLPNATHIQQNHGRTDSSSSSATSSSNATATRMNKQEEVAFYALQNQQRQIHSTYALSVVEALWDFSGDDENDLSFSKGEIIEVTEHVNTDWWRGTNVSSGKNGLFPRIYTRIILTSQFGDNPSMGNYFSHVPQPQLRHSHSMTFQNGQGRMQRPTHQPSPGNQYSQQATTTYASQSQRIINAANGPPRHHTRNMSNESTSVRAQHSNSPIPQSSPLAQTRALIHQNIGSTT